MCMYMYVCGKSSQLEFEIPGLVSQLNLEFFFDIYVHRSEKKQQLIIIMIVKEPQLCRVSFPFSIHPFQVLPIPLRPLCV